MTLHVTEYRSDIERGLEEFVKSYEERRGSRTYRLVGKRIFDLLFTVMIAPIVVPIGNF